MLYRVAQEALTNIVKHAKARHTRVALQVGHGQATLEVADDGTGYGTTVTATLPLALS